MAISANTAHIRSGNELGLCESQWPRQKPQVMRLPAEVARGRLSHALSGAGLGLAPLL